MPCPTSGPGTSQHGNTMRAVRAGRGEVTSRDPPQREYGELCIDRQCIESIPPQGPRAGVRLRRQHRTEHGKIGTQKRSGPQLFCVVARCPDQRDGRPFPQCGELPGGEVNAVDTNA